MLTFNFFYILNGKKNGVKCLERKNGIKCKSGVKYLESKLEYAHHNCSCFYPEWCSSCRLSLGTFSWYQYLGMFLFLWASWHQWSCHNILAKLRHLASGKTVMLYRIPYGDWFEYVSSPHYLAEILIYSSFFIIQKGQNIYVGLILLFTIQNLSLGATVTHEWYHNKFKDYPKNRNRILPFLF